MPTTLSKKFLSLLRYLGKWLVLASIVAVLAGSASALFLTALAWVTGWRGAHRWIVWGLPLAGFAVGWVYLRFGAGVEAGIRLLIDEVHAPRQTVAWRMAPLVLGATVVSHLFGASVGREGTAVQMGGALADQLTGVFRLNPAERRLLILAGISAGFASVFGTPLAGAVFGLEVLALARLRAFAWPQALFPCLVAAWLSDQVGLWWGVHHTHYLLAGVASISLATLLATLAAGMLFGLAAMLFTRATHAIATVFKHRIAYPPLRPFAGGCLIALAAWITASDRYLGLGVPVIVEAFVHPLPVWDALAKTAFTALSLGAGFKGGEVTPLFFIGATFGNALAPLLQLPFAMSAALGFVAVFAGAAKTPLVSTIMAVELFGPAIAPYAALACAVSYWCSGRAGIYRKPAP